VALAPKSGVERPVVERFVMERFVMERLVVERLALKRLAMERLAMERVLPDGLLRELAGQGWEGRTQLWGRRAAGWLLRLELLPSHRSAGAAVPSAPRPAG
jgi:hypothetical protein